MTSTFQATLPDYHFSTRPGDSGLCQMHLVFFCNSILTLFDIAALNNRCETVHNCPGKQSRTTKLQKASSYHFKSTAEKSSNSLFEGLKYVIIVMKLPHFSSASSFGSLLDFSILLSSTSMSCLSVNILFKS